MIDSVSISLSGWHTTNHIDCPACRQGSVLDRTEISPQLTFRDAFAAWIALRVIEQPGYATRVRYISERGERDLRQYARGAGKFFDALSLDQIHAGHLREFQKARAFNLVVIAGQGETHPWEHAAGANLIRKEVQTVLRVMRAAGVWTEDDDKTFDLVEAVDDDVPRAMTAAEQHHWLRTSSRRPEWAIVYAWSLVALQTTAATNEMRALRLGDIYLDQGTMQIRSEGAKNKFRIRTIPLQTPEVVWALGELMARARRLGASGPHHYLFPFHLTGDRYDPLRPMTVWGMRKPWDAVKAASGLEYLTPYLLRHTAITRMAEAGVPIQVIMSFAGHIRPQMQEHYTQISMQAKRRWAAAAWAGAEMPYAPGPGYALPAQEPAETLIQGRARRRA